MNLHKKALFICAFLSITICVFAENRPYELLDIDYHLVLDNSVNVRAEPNLNGRVLGQLNAGDYLIIDENTYIEQEIDGILAYWYKIRSKEIRGYMWGGYIATGSLITGSDDFINDKDIGNFDIYYRYSLNDNDSDGGPAFEIDKDVFIYKDNQRIVFPTNVNDSMWANECEAYIFDGVIYLYFFCWTPRGFTIDRFFIDNNDVIQFIDEGIRWHHYR
jgi:hypothetical protein